MADRSHWLRHVTCAVIALLTSFILTEPASAHVKWFCAYDVAGSPRGLENVLHQDFELLVILALLILAIGCLIEGSSFSLPLLRAMDRVTYVLRKNTELMFRAGATFFLVSLFVLGGIILTPELKTASPLISWLQLGMALCLISRRTMPLTAIGIVFLFALGVWNYGVFHMADYPIFLGVAAYLALTGLRKDFYGIRPLDIVRWAAGITLMWASIEKWAYPQWSFPLFIEHPAMTLGYDQEFFMRAAGVIEFTLAFAIMWTPLVRRSAAAMLAGMFIAACFEFGMIDVIGHSLIIVVLLAIVSDDRRVTFRKRYALLAPVVYSAAWLDIW